MDVTRGSAVLLVVAFHSATFMRYGGMEAPALVVEANRWFAPFRMPVLVFMSGLLTPASLRKGAARYVEGKLRHVAWPYVVWTCTFAVLAWPVDDPIGYATGGTYLWYLAFLVLYYGIALATVRVHPVVVAGAAMVAAVLAEDGTKWGERFWVLLVFFMLGAAAACSPRVWERLLADRAVLVVASCVTGLLVALAVTGAVPGGYVPLTAVGSATGVLLIIRLAQVVGESPLLTPLRFAGRHSIVYYVSHVQTIYCVAHLAERAGASSSWGVYALTLGSSTALATLCALLVERHPGLGVGWLFTWRPGRRAARVPVAAAT